MIHAIATPLPLSQIRELRDWLRLPGAELFRELLLANIALRQAEAGRALILAREDGNHLDQDALEFADEARIFQNTLSVLDDFRTSEEQLNKVTLSLDQPVQVEETPNP